MHVKKCSFKNSVSAGAFKNRSFILIFAIQFFLKTVLMKLLYKITICFTKFRRATEITYVYLKKKQNNCRVNRFRSIKNRSSNCEFHTNVIFSCCSSQKKIFYHVFLCFFFDILKTFAWMTSTGIFLQKYFLSLQTEYLFDFWILIDFIYFFIQYYLVKLVVRSLIN